MASVDASVIFGLFADMLDYPSSQTAKSAAECERFLGDVSPDAASLIGQFTAFLAKTSPGKLEEVYTGTFDMNLSYAPYVGYHLFGETYSRSSFLISLRERYNERGFEYQGVEVPDHIVVILRFLSANPARTVEDEKLIHDSLLPALRKMVSGDSSSDDAPPGSADRGAEPYMNVGRSLCLVLERIGSDSLTSGKELTGESVA